MTLPTHDFTRPSRLPMELKAQSAPWLKRGNAIFTESMLSMGLTLQTQFLDQNTAWPLDTLDEWTGKPLGFRLLLAGSPTILALPNRLAQCLVGGLLGESLSAEWVERELSQVEVNLCEMTISTLLKSLIEAWIGESPLVLELQSREPNLRRSKLFRPNDPLVVCRSSVTIQDSEHLWSWLIRLETMQELFGSEKPKPVTSPTAPQKQQMESVMRSMTLPMTVKLGHVQLSASQLAELQIGDVVVLHQRTSDPMKAFVSGRPAFLGWPGQIGNKQAFRIEADLAK